MLDDFLLQVKKPGRYIGGEWNISKKDFAQAKIKFALCFPDLYEVGMSNLGLRIIYGILNAIEDVSCERVFSVAPDLEAILRKESREIFSLESRRPLKEFDIIGFSLAYELSYTNVLNMLELGSLPLRAAQREAGYPLIIAGGPCVLNPEPMQEFFDAFVIGEAEEVIVEIITLYREFKSGLNRPFRKQDLLLALSSIEGVYVPALAKPVKKRILKNLSRDYFPVSWLIPHIQVVHDRITLEIMRGCPSTCRFCQARSQYFPYRIRKVEELLELAGTTYKNSGYEEISLCGLSISDYPYLEELLNRLIVIFKDKAVSLSLPSLKPKAKLGGLSGLIASIKKTGLTFAPEAGSNKLREVLSKNFSEEAFYQTITEAFGFGYQQVKLYFMIGLPQEEAEDLVAIIDFSRRVSKMRTNLGKPRAQVNISVNTLIPKPHTPLQWLGMLGLDQIKDKQAYLRKLSRDRFLKLSLHNPYMSILEGILCRGDRRLSEAIELAFRKGARFDAWDEHFEFSRWAEAFNELGIDYNAYLKERPREETLPWDFIDVGISKESLLTEFNKLFAIK